MLCLRDSGHCTLAYSFGHTCRCRRHDASQPAAVPAQLIEQSCPEKAHSGGYSIDEHAAVHAQAQKALEEKLEGDAFLQGRVEKVTVGAHQKNVYSVHR